MMLMMVKFSTPILWHSHHERQLVVYLPALVGPYRGTSVGAKWTPFGDSAWWNLTVGLGRIRVSNYRNAYVSQQHENHQWKTADELRPTNGSLRNLSFGKKGMVVDLILPFKRISIMLGVLYLSCLNVSDGSSIISQCKSIFDLCQCFDYLY